MSIRASVVLDLRENVANRVSTEIMAVICCMNSTSTKFIPRSCQILHHGICVILVSLYFLRIRNPFQRSTSVCRHHANTTPPVCTLSIHLLVFVMPVSWELSAKQVLLERESCLHNSVLKLQKINYEVSLRVNVEYAVNKH